MLHEILDVMGVERHSRDAFTMSLRKLGAYSEGMWSLWKGLKGCEDGYIVKDITLALVPSQLPESSTTTVECWPSWEKFIEIEAEKILHSSLSVPPNVLRSSTALSSYNPNPSVLLHAEMNLALFKKRHGIRSGDIGISRDCCAACFTGFNALYESDYKYRVKGTHDKIYLSRLTGEDVMDKAIYDFISWSFR